MYQITVNNQPARAVAFTAEGQPTLNGEAFAWDIVRIDDRTLHILHQNKSYTAELLDMNRADKTLRLNIGGAIYDIQAKDRFDVLLETMGMSSAATTKINNLKAPMPGLIAGISVQPGQVLAPGDTVLVLVAMKMENNLKSPGAGTVKKILVQPGNRVEKGQVLVEFV
jgi:biotin carboxyl carrier protein